MTQLAALDPAATPGDVQPLLINNFARQLAITDVSWSESTQLPLR